MSAFFFEIVISLYFFSVHKPTRRNFTRRKVVVPNVNHTVMADLIDYRKYSRANKGFKYILVIIDAFSRFAYTAPLKFKTAEDSANAIDSILETFLHPPVMFSSDKGNEFTVKNPFIKKVLVDKYKMNVFTMSGRTKVRSEIDLKISQSILGINCGKVQSNSEIKTRTLFYRK